MKRQYFIKDRAPPEEIVSLFQTVKLVEIVTKPNLADNLHHFYQIF